ncbi:MAG TPA: uridine diphosphate-N-acetylglucosamine-binding protein YvcK [Acidobacteriaceae bacterium]|nr:uridine diphosphate-N-acetylglucosamine-binding protein YvcK [Acidobacteriaceae bacterium]
MGDPILPQLRVVAIGGGTGLSTLLRGLRRFVATPGSPTGFDRRAGARYRSNQPVCPHASCLIRELAAVVTVTDDGGSSGRLREELNMLPPGDIRNCLVALSEDEHLLSQLFQYRFAQGDLGGHSFGNLFLAALNGISGDFAEAVRVSSQILATRGKIFPATVANATLLAKMDDGSVVRGETNITASRQSIVELMLDPAEVDPLPETLEAIANADVITLGPGSLYTSLITNLLVRGIPEAIARSKATRIYICNLMTQANESLGLTASQHIEKIQNHCGGPTGGRLFDYALINTAPIRPETVEQYAREGQEPIVADLDRVRQMGVEPIAGNFVHEGDVLRHSDDQVADTVLRLGIQKRAAA